MPLRRWRRDQIALEKMDDAQGGFFGGDAKEGHGEVVAEVGKLLLQHMRGMVVVAETKEHAAPFEDDTDQDGADEVTGNDEYHGEGQENEAEQAAFARRLLRCVIRHVVFRLACHTPSVALLPQSSNPSSSAVSSASIWSCPRPEPNCTSLSSPQARSCSRMADHCSLPCSSRSTSAGLK